MYLASLYISFDLDPSIPQMDKDRLLLSLREKLKQKFKNKLSIKIDEPENAIAIAFFEHNFEKIRINANNIIEHFEERSEARISFHHEQIFSWFNGEFIDTQQNKVLSWDPLNKHSNFNSKTSSLKTTDHKTIVYSDSDEDDSVPIPSRFTRRNFRIPTRK
jgi:hypothetical protein